MRKVSKMSCLTFNIPRRSQVAWPHGGVSATSSIMQESKAFFNIDIKTWFYL